MGAKKNGNIFEATNILKVFNFLSKNPGKEFVSSEIQKATSISRSGVYVALQELIRAKLASKYNRGKISIYSIIYNDPVVKQFKVLKTMVRIRPIVEKLKETSKKIVLYGSTSRGEDYPGSDIDIFVLSKDPEQTQEILISVKLKEKLQAIIKTPSEFAEFKEKEKVFCFEVEQGIVLWVDE